jgi:hypothetical protein
VLKLSKASEQKKLDDIRSAIEDDFAGRVLVIAGDPKNNTSKMRIGNRNSHIFHRPSCQLRRVKSRIFFSTSEKAIVAGYKPCKRCNP